MNEANKTLSAGNCEEVGKVSHDLENELAGIRMRVDLVLASLDNDQQHDLDLLRSDLEQILAATDRSIRVARALARWMHDGPAASPERPAT